MKVNEIYFAAPTVLPAFEVLCLSFELLWSNYFRWNHLLLKIKSLWYLITAMSVSLPFTIAIDLQACAILVPAISSDYNCTDKCELNCYSFMKGRYMAPSITHLPFTLSLNKSLLSENWCSFPNWKVGGFFWVSRSELLEHCGVRKRKRDEEVYPCILIASCKKLILLDIRETHF